MHVCFRNLQRPSESEIAIIWHIQQPRPTMPLPERWVEATDRRTSGSGGPRQVGRSSEARSLIASRTMQVAVASHHHHHERQRMLELHTPKLRQHGREKCLKTPTYLIIPNTFTGPGEGGQTRVVNGLTAGASPDAGGERAHRGCPHSVWRPDAGGKTPPSDGHLRCPR